MWNHAIDMRTGEAVSADEISRYYKFGYRSMVKLSGKKAGKVYDSFDAAVRARVQAVANYPGHQTIHESSAQVLTQRGTKTNSNGTVQFSHDVRANNFGTMQVLTLKQTMSFLANLPPTLVLMAEYGFPNSREGAFERAKLLDATRVQVQNVDGTSHHLHLDEPERIAKLILSWAGSELGGDKAWEVEPVQTHPIWPGKPQANATDMMPPTDEFFAGPKTAAKSRL
jgi:pimeloyl-ACP methyl ester carboxylesterase